MKILREMLSDVVSLFVPRSCLLCGSSLTAGMEYVCDACRVRLPLTRFHADPDNAMLQRIDPDLPIVRASAIYYYSRGSSVAHLVHCMKYRGMPRLAMHLGRDSATMLYPVAFFSDVDCLIPIPLHWRRRLKRGYNQAEMFARGVSQETGIPLLTGVLKAGRAHRSQTKHTVSQRRRNLQGVFKLEYPEAIEGKHVMLIDDVCTTGATISNAVRTILDATRTTSGTPAVRVSVLTLASVY